MKNIILGFTIAIGFLLVKTQPGAAVPLQELDLNELNEEPIGIMMATFDPLTTHHQEVIEVALKTQMFKRLVVIPADFTPTKLRRTSTDKRHGMLARVFKDDQRVVTVDPYQYGFPQSRGLIMRLKAQHGLHVVGVGLAMDLGSPLKNKILSFLTPVDEWLVLTPDQRSRASLPEVLGQARVRFVEASMPPSSEKVRDFLVQHPDLYANLDTMLAVPVNELPLSSEARQVIFANKLYQTRSHAFGMPYDALQAALPYRGYFAAAAVVGTLAGTIAGLKFIK